MKSQILASTTIALRDADFKSSLFEGLAFQAVVVTGILEPEYRVKLEAVLVSPKKGLHDSMLDRYERAGSLSKAERRNIDSVRQKLSKIISDDAYLFRSAYIDYDALIQKMRLKKGEAIALITVNGRGEGIHRILTALRGKIYLERISLSFEGDRRNSWHFKHYISKKDYSSIIEEIEDYAEKRNMPPDLLKLEARTVSDLLEDVVGNPAIPLTTR